MLALFSIYSIFFYSTFLTSVWAWIYCFSTWFMRLFSKTFLSRLLAIEERPCDQIALVGAIIFGLGVLTLAPVLTRDETRSVSWIDIQLCKWFPDEVCPHVVRLTDDEKETLDYFLENCSALNARSCLRKIRKFYGRNYQKAESLFRTSCDLGSIEACSHLGWMLWQGYGIEQDYVQASKFFQSACDGNHGIGCTYLGSMFANGLGVTQDDAKAVQFYRLGCNFEDAEGCQDLAFMHANGRGTAKDEEQAANLYRKSCNGGHAYGCFSLGWALEKGQGTQKDVPKQLNYIVAPATKD